MLTSIFLPSFSSLHVLYDYFYKAPFGYIIGGKAVYDKLKPGDVIDTTIVDEFGQLNLDKLRQSSLKEAASASEAS